jgi:MFS family permease
MHHKPKHLGSESVRGDVGRGTRRRWLLPLLLVAQLMVILDITAVNIALPSVASDLELTGSDISWTITSYSLIFGSLLLPLAAYPCPGTLRGFKSARRWPVGFE